MAFQRGEVYSVDLNPTVGGEIQKHRPAVVVSSNPFNAAASIVVICPITDATGKTSPIHIAVLRGEGGLQKDSVVHCGQLRAVDASRFDNKLGNLPAEKMREIDKGLKLVLSL